MKILIKSFYESERIGRNKQMLLKLGFEISDGCDSERSLLSCLLLADGVSSLLLADGTSKLGRP